MKNNKLFALVVSIAAPFVAGGIGAAATYPNIAGWYAGLAKPFFNPPNWVFGPVWTLLYVLMGVALYLVWTSRTKRNKKFAVQLFVAQLVLNSLWSIMFFGLHELWMSTFVIIGLLVLIAVLIKLFWTISKPAAYLLVPYLAWVSFATALNISIAFLN